VLVCASASSATSRPVSAMKVSSSTATNSRRCTSRACGRSLGSYTSCCCCLCYSRSSRSSGSRYWSSRTYHPCNPGNSCTGCGATCGATIPCCGSSRCRSNVEAGRASPSNRWGFRAPVRVDAQRMRRRIQSPSPRGPFDMNRRRVSPRAARPTPSSIRLSTRVKIIPFRTNYADGFRRSRRPVPEHVGVPPLEQEVIRIRTDPALDDA
jgi:hypothetical protein